VITLLGAGVDTFLEVGPHPALAGGINARAKLGGREVMVLASARRDAGERAELLRSLGALAVGGHPVRLDRAFGPPGRVVSLPAYPWQRQRHWFDGSPAIFPATAVAITARERSAGP